jgi:hypothetical protein
LRSQFATSNLEDEKHRGGRRYFPYVFTEQGIAMLSTVLRGDIATHKESEQRLFCNGQIYDAFSLIASIIKKANFKLILIDNYVDIDTLNLLAKKNKNVESAIYTLENTKLSEIDVANFNKQYPKLTLQYTRVFHDRFLILDDMYVYHIGASIKDAGKKCFAISLIEDIEIVHGILKRLKH